MVGAVSGRTAATTGGGSVTGGAGSRRVVRTVGPLARTSPVPRMNIRVSPISRSAGGTDTPLRHGGAHCTVKNRVRATTWITAVINHTRPVGWRATRRSNSGKHLSQPLRCLDESRRGDGQRNTEKSLRARAERAAGQGNDADVLERPLLEGRRAQPLGQWDPEVQRGARWLDFEPVGAQDRNDRVAPLLELRGVACREVLGLLQDLRAGCLH